MELISDQEIRKIDGVRNSQPLFFLIYEYKRSTLLTTNLENGELRMIDSNMNSSKLSSKNELNGTEYLGRTPTGRIRESDSASK